MVTSTYLRWCQFLRYENNKNKLWQKLTSFLTKEVPDKLLFAIHIVAEKIEPNSMDDVVNTDIAPIKIIFNNNIAQLTVL